MILTRVAVRPRCGAAEPRLDAGAFLRGIEPPLSDVDGVLAALRRSCFTMAHFAALRAALRNGAIHEDTKQRKLRDTERALCLATEAVRLEL